jgi:hypothetical protein
MGSFLSKMAPGYQAEPSLLLQEAQGACPGANLAEARRQLYQKAAGVQSASVGALAADLPKPDAPVFFEYLSKGVGGLMLHANPTITW